LVAIDDAMAQVLWTRNFLTAQGMFLLTTTIYQDNKITILLAKNRKSSSRRSTRHLDIRYFFVTQNQERRSEAAFRPTDDMLGDFFTKPLQGSLSICMQERILNLPNSTSTTVHKHLSAQEGVGKRKNMRKSKNDSKKDSANQNNNLANQNKKRFYGTEASQKGLTKNDEIIGKIVNLKLMSWRCMR